MATQDPPRSARLTGKKGPTGTNQLTGSSRFRAATPSRITHLRVRGTGLHIELPAVVAYKLGRTPTHGDPPEPRAEVLIPSPRKGVSLVHAMFEWRQDLLWCRDAGSTNGILANQEPQRDWFCVVSGMVLDLGDVSLIAMDWRLTELCEPLAWCLGLDAIQKVDRALSLVQIDRPLLLTGPRNCDQEWLARKIHEVSRRREQPFTAFTTALPRNAEAGLDHAKWGTVFVDLPSVGKVTTGFANKLFDGVPPQFKLRPIIAAPSHLEAQRAFQHLVEGHKLELPALASRRDDILPLIDRLMKKHKSSRRVQDLGSPWVERLVKRKWSNNLGELRRAETVLRAWLESDQNKTQAAKLVGTSRQAFATALNRLLEE